MMEQLHVHVEVWPVAGDEIGLWLVSGKDAWRSGPVGRDLGPHDEVEHVLVEHGVTSRSSLVHSTSWRTEQGHIVLTYLAVLTTAGLVREQWPASVPIDPRVADAVGKPTPTDPTGEPLPRHIDVLLHAIRHVRFLSLTDGPARRALPAVWHRHLEAWTPALSGMYDDEEDVSPALDPALISSPSTNHQKAT